MIDRKWIGHAFEPIEMVLERGRLSFFAKAIGETNPVYTDPAAAQAAGYADLPAPPTFLFAAELDAGIFERLLELLEIPIAKVLHGEQEFSYYTPACAGDSITVRSQITDISDKKGGLLELVIKTSEAYNARNELVAEMRTTIVVRH